MITENGIAVKGPGLISGLHPEVLTHNIGEAMEACRVVVCVSSGRQKEIAEWMSPYIRSVHSLLLMPGNLGALVFHRIFEKEGSNLIEICLNSPNVITHLSGTLLNLASGISGTDYYRMGRTWEWIGKDGARNAILSFRLKNRAEISDSSRKIRFYIPGGKGDVYFPVLYQRGD